ncbi:MAG TPA: antibiotic biosynthesis monooxygenase family protein [Mycobacteriales bacterium]|jgi:heme-degrading monooxygenase HmoA|nr:antibiotic biosynthesis monooxygenase family protein [Mycobacteriales bacterium]
MSPIPFVNCFEVPAGQEDEFLARWTEVNDYMRAKPGYVGHRLHRSLSPEARFRFVNLAQWDTVEDCQAAHDEGFRRLVSQPGWAGFTSTQAIYQVVHEGTAESARSPHA